VRAVSSPERAVEREVAMLAGDEKMLRAARNQALYREVNEKLEALNEAFAVALDAGGSWVCECADLSCAEAMELTLGEYEALRAHPNRFAVLPGHVLPDVERIVEDHGGYVVVEKLGPGASFAAEMNPRRSTSSTGA
jgi:hypothetical protein